MLPERLNFLSEFGNFYNRLVLDIKEDKYNEAEFYLIVIGKCKSLDRERRERLIKLEKKSKEVQVVLSGEKNLRSILKVE